MSPWCCPGNNDFSDYSGTCVNQEFLGRFEGTANNQVYYEAL